MKNEFYTYRGGGNKAGGFFLNRLTLIFFSFFLTVAAFPPLVQSIVIFLTPSQDITITILNKSEISSGSRMFLYAQGVGRSQTPVTERFFQTTKTQNMLFLEGRYERNVIYGDIPQTFIKINGVKSPTYWIGFIKDEASSKIKIEWEGKSEIYDLYASTPAEYIIHPFQGDGFSTALFIALNIIAYAVCFCLIFFFAVVLINIIKRFKKDFLTRDCNKYGAFVFFFVVLMVICLGYFRVGGPLMGDAVWYWYKYPLPFSTENYLETVSQNKAVFRSYLLPFINACFRWIAHGDNNLGRIYYFVFSCLMGAFFISTVMPSLYEIFNKGKKASNAQAYSFGILLVFFWWGYFYEPLTDMFAVILYFSTVLCFLRGLAAERETGKLFYFFLSGFCLAGSVLMRGNYVIIVKLALLYLLAACVFNLLVKKFSGLNKIKKIFPGLDRFGLSHMVVLFLGIFIICLPQIIINLYRGELSFFEYDKVGVWTSPFQTLTEFNSAQATAIYLQGYPHILLNPIGKFISQGALPGVEVARYTLGDCLAIYLSDPFKAIVSFAAKIFLFFDIKTSIVYRDGGIFFFTEFHRILFSLINYAVIGLVLLTMFYGKLRRQAINRGETLFVATVFLLIGLPMIMMHVEWRYILPCYIALYYIVSYGLVGIMTRGPFIGYRYVGAKVLLMMVVMFALSTLLYISWSQ